MTLDQEGVRISCPSCKATNRLRYASLERATKCGKCHAPLSHPAEPIEVPHAAAFDAATRDSAIPVVVDFWAAWCGPCRLVAPEVEKVAKEFAGRALVLKVDTEANQELAGRLNIRSIPTIAVFHRGRELNRAAGVRPASAIAAMISPR